MNIDKEKLVKNLIIYAIISAVLTVIVGAGGLTDNLAMQIFAGCLFGFVLYIPVRLFPSIGLLGSIIVLVVEVVVLTVVTSFLGETLGTIVGLVLLAAGFIASLLFM